MSQINLWYFSFNFWWPIPIFWIVSVRNWPYLDLLMSHDLSIFPPRAYQDVPMLFAHDPAFLAEKYADDRATSFLGILLSAICSIYNIFIAEMKQNNSQAWGDNWKARLCTTRLYKIILHTYTGWLKPAWKSHPIMAAAQSMSNFLATLFRPAWPFESTTQKYCMNENLDWMQILTKLSYICEKNIINISSL